jgi:hypothetical protein
MEVEVDGEAWTEVENFLSSTETDKHFTVEIGNNDKATIVFGDGSNGMVPPIGTGNIAAVYRFGANLEGNAGAGTVEADRSGLSYINRLWNPRGASGWAEAEGSSPESLEKAKVAGPASLRVKEVALGPNDVEILAKQYKGVSGASPFSRARAIEEGFGPKTVELVLVAKGGSLASADQLAEIQEYFNGDAYASPPKEKHMVANQQVVAVNFTPKLIDVTATVYGTGLSIEAIENRLSQVLQPEALKDDGASFEWEFGADVPVSRIIHEIFETSESITRVDVSLPAGNVELLSRELPVLGTVTITVVEE